MRLLLFLGFVTAVVGLFDAIIWEAESFYKAYLMERMLYPTEPDKWVICPDCKATATDAFRAELRALGLPENTASIAEFLSSIGTKPLKTFGHVNGNIDFRWKTMNYRMIDLLEELRRMRWDPEIKLFSPKFSGKKLFRLDFMPDSVRTAEVVNLVQIQVLMTKRVEQIRQAATGAVSEGIERLVRGRIDALRMDNMYRVSDQWRWKKQWYASELNIGEPPKRFNLITNPDHIVFPDGTVPHPDPLNTSPEHPNIETWEAIDQDATLAQGGHSPLAVARRKADAQKASAYGKSGKSSPAAQEHQAVIETNLSSEKWHESPAGHYFSCGGKKTKRGFLRNKY
ncbi:hypothetical protein IF1G_03130 [Cordyceps javanica]|uniref:Uncharacterized protein n=1 Tax=Cordyceps javanica TaxID=43265 RepID=A0A545W8S1_9HYPO|nr:hypothetical protein IF1G_03130 [Cordyceps javanica]TQW10265.1 hypothetical protein IF2G_03055 [Cordyceps javanica]